MKLLFCELNLIFFLLRNLILNRRPGRALKQMEFLPNYKKDLQKYIHDYVQTEAAGIKNFKEVAVADFDRYLMESFSYDTYYENALTNYPILTAVLTGALSSQRFIDS